MEVQCLDPKNPCPPKPKCVPVTENLQISDRMFVFKTDSFAVYVFVLACSLMDCQDGFKCITLRTNCVKAPCPVTPVEGKCVPINATEEEIRVTRSAEDALASDRKLFL